MRIAGILVVAWILQALAGRLIRVFRAYLQARRSGHDEVRRIDTLARVFRNTSVIVIVLVAGMLVLNELGISIAPILATAGVAGIAIGFGAQSLIKDYFNGFFLLLEDQIREGDVVEIAGLAGMVEEVTLRHVRLRNFEGHVHFVPNGEIKIVTNRTRDYAHAVVEVAIAFRQDPDRALELMRQVGLELRADPAWGPRIADDPEIAGVERWASDASIVLRCRVRVVPAVEQWNVRREYLKRLRRAYEAAGIELPAQHITLHQGEPR